MTATFKKLSLHRETVCRFQGSEVVNRDQPADPGPDPWDPDPSPWDILRWIFGWD